MGLRKARAFLNLHEVHKIIGKVCGAPPVEVRRVTKNFKNPRYSVHAAAPVPEGRLILVPLASTLQHITAESVHPLRVQLVPGDR
eukprot:12258492-Alexandrium_andersonii.AAC.1